MIFDIEEMKILFHYLPNWMLKKLIKDVILLMNYHEIKIKK